MSYFSFSAICPRCDGSIKSTDFICDNCRKGIIKAKDITYRSSGYKGCKSFSFHCEKCHAGALIIKCKCGASIQPEQIE
jgi:hypothetical protein